MKKIRRTGLLCMAAVLLLGAAPLKAYAADAPKGMDKVAENEYLTLYLNDKDTSLAVVDNATGKVWYTNPQDEDTFASAFYQRLLKSQLQILYYNENVQSSTMDNFNDSIQDEQFTIEETENGVTVTYTIGAAVGTMLLPDAISEERYLYYFNQMDSGDQKRVNRNYVYVELTNPTGSDEIAEYLETYPGFTTNFYVLRGGVRDYLKEDMEEYFINAGYTAEELEADIQESGIGESENSDPWFIIPMTYQLDGKNLVVTIDPEKVEYNEAFYPVRIDVLPYFGATAADDGYLFVPDGSGALIYLNNGKTAASSYSALVYGQDETKQVLTQTKSEIDPKLTIKMPVFGVKSGDQALFAVIEDGAAYANVAADISGRTTSYNQVNAGFQYLQYGQASLSEMVGSNGYQLYSSPQFAGTYRLRYSFLTGEKADYSGMADCYRQYLEGNGVLTKSDETEVPFFAEYIGAINKYKTILGVKYDAVEPLTTFAQSEEITDQLMGLGVDNQKVVFSGWANGGMHGTAGFKQKAVSSLKKGGVSAEKFQTDMASKGVDTYMTVEMQYVYKDKMLDGYSTLQYAPSYFDHSNIEVNSYFFADNSLDEKLADLISPYYADKTADSILSGVGKYGIRRLNLGSVSNYLYSDFLESRYTDRQMAMGLYQQSLDKMAGQMDSMLGDNGNDYVWKYTDYMINVPQSSNGYQILDEDVPFYEMVLHGSIPYAGEAINLADDYRTTLLKSVESGAGLHFQWIYGDNSLVNETDFDYLYSVHYGNWIDRAAADYKRVEEALAGLGNQKITAHSRDGSVTKTTYESGTTVYVNYSKDKVTVDGTEIGARDFAVVKASAGEGE